MSVHAYIKEKKSHFIFNISFSEIPENFDISICENNNKTVWCTSHLHCVLKEKVCDRVLHCHDGSDESMCPAKFRNGKCSLLFDVCKHCEHMLFLVQIDVF